ncbi:hypothetical protein D3C80_1818530 [compost metagenome]
MEFTGDALQLLQHLVVAVDDERVQVERNVYEAYGAGEYNQREIMAARKLDHLLGNRAEVSPELDAQTGGVFINQIL